jgi:hypothetical protein
MEVIDIVSKANRSMTPFLDLRDGEVTLSDGKLGGSIGADYSLTSMLCEAEGRSRRPSTRVTQTAHRKRIQWVI